MDSIRKIINYLIFQFKNKVKYLLFQKKSPYSITIEGNPKNISIGKNCLFSRDVTLSTKHGGKITIGDDCIFQKGVIMATFGGDITIGNDCSFNPYCVIYGHGGLKIDNYVRIATHTVIIPANHIFSSKEIPITYQGITKKGISINKDVWIGANVTILDGVEIGEGSVIAAGAVVTSIVNSYSVYGGVPAKFLKLR